MKYVLLVTGFLVWVAGQAALVTLIVTAVSSGWPIFFQSAAIIGGGLGLIAGFFLGLVGLVEWAES